MEVLDGLLAAEEFRRLVRRRKDVTGRINDFVEAMGSDGQLRKLAIEGRCQECPSVRVRV